MQVKKSTENSAGTSKSEVEPNSRSKVIINYINGDVEEINCYRSNVKEGCLEISWEEADKSRKLQVTPWHRINFVEIFSTPKEQGA